MTSHSSSSHDNHHGGWEQQLQAAERQYSDFFPDLELPPGPQQQQQQQQLLDSHHQGQRSAHEEQAAVVDPSTLFREDTYMTAVLSLGVVALDHQDLVPGASSAAAQLDAGRRYSQSSIAEMHGLDKLETSFEKLVNDVSR